MSVNIIHKDNKRPINVAPSCVVDKGNKGPINVTPGFVAGKNNIDEHQTSQINNIKEQLNNLDQIIEQSISNNSTLNNNYNSLNERLNNLINTNLIEHTFFIKTTIVNPNNINNWNISDARITSLKDGVSLILIVPNNVSNNTYPITLNINGLTQCEIICDVSNLNKKFILSVGSTLQLVCIKINNNYYFVIINDSSDNADIQVSENEPAGNIGTIWFDTTNTNN